MNQSLTYGITGRTELGLNEYIETRPAYADHGPAYLHHTLRTYTIQAQEDACLFNLREPYFSEAADRYYSDVPDNEPNHEPDAYLEYAPYVPCEQACYVTEAGGWTLVTAFDLSSDPTPFKSLPIGAEFYDPYTQDIALKTSDQEAVVVAAGDLNYVGRVYGFIDDSIPMNNTVYPVLTHTAQDLAEDPTAQDLLVAQEWAPGGPADALLQAEDDWVPETLATDPPQDHPEGWNAPAAPVYPLPQAADSPETQGIPVTYKVTQGNCYRLMHHGRQVAIVPNYGQGEVIAQALAATFAGRLADFSLTLDYIEGATP